MRPDAAPEQNVGAFIMNPEGVARLHAVGMAEGPFPEHYEPFETPVGVNLMCPNNPKAISNPAARVYKGDLEAFGKAEEFPYAATTYRLTEHFHFWTKHAQQQRHRCSRRRSSRSARSWRRRRASSTATW